MHRSFRVLIIHMLATSMVCQDCPPGVPEVNCNEDPCSVFRCTGRPEAICQPNFCGVCHADFYVGETVLTEDQCDGSNIRVPCPEDDVCEGGAWTVFADFDVPGDEDGGDFETIPNVAANGVEVCPLPTNVDVALFNGDSYETSGQLVHISLFGGFKCIDAEQPFGLCENYRARFCCPKNELYIGRPEVSCTTWGDAHYETLDGVYYNFPGLCTYNFLSVAGGAQSSLPYSFAVWLENYESIHSNTLTVQKRVHVRFFGQVVTLDRSRSAEINGRPLVDSYYSDPFYGYEIQDDGVIVKFTSAFGLVVLYDGRQYVHATIARNYTGQVSGLCGNFNYNSLDDLNGLAAEEANDFLHSNVVATGCLEPESIQECDPYLLWQAPFVCNAVYAPCFHNCSSLSPNRHSFYESCVHDYCKHGGTEQSVITALGHYHLHCSATGASPCNDVNVSLDDVQCPLYTSFQRCGFCPQTCTHSTLEVCSPCIAGCICDSAYLVNVDSNYVCGPEETCACKAGDLAIYARNCTLQCFCGIFPFCFQSSCLPNQRCEDNMCVESTCPVGSSYQECGSSCQPKCFEEPMEMCLTVCEAGCQCDPGLVLNEATNECVPPGACVCGPDDTTFLIDNCTRVCFCSQTDFCVDFDCGLNGVCVNNECLDSICPLGATYLECGSSCPPKCFVEPPASCPFVCVEGCQCNGGYFLNEITNQCVPEEACICGLGDFVTISEDCTRSCFCQGIFSTCFDFVCPFGTECVNGTCVESRDCPAGAEYSECLGACAPTCFFLNRDPSLCEFACNGGCVCQDDLVLDESTRECVAVENCSFCPLSSPTGTAAPQMYFGRNCTVACRCSGVLSPICSDFYCDPAVASCIGGTCMPHSPCATPGAYQGCGAPCQPTCSNPSPDCASEACVEGCHCMDGLVLHEDLNQCVVAESCGCYYEQTNSHLAIGYLLTNETHACVCEPTTGLRCVELDCELLNCKCTNGTCLPAGFTQCYGGPVNSIQSDCATSCPPTCGDPSAPACNDSCIPGCLCPDNLLLNETTNTCVFPDACGGGDCFDDNGNPVPEIRSNFSTFFLRQKCELLCICFAGNVLCMPFYCPAECVENNCLWLPAGPGSQTPEVLLRRMAGF